MLVDLKLNSKDLSAWGIYIVEQGVYEGSFNFNLLIDLSPIYKRDRDSEYSDHSRSYYGVADNLDQIKSLYADLIHSEESNVVISLAKIEKVEEPEEGGWRWHKWGEYIGTQSPQCEYLYDEPEIESIYVFHVHKVNVK